MALLLRATVRPVAMLALACAVCGLPGCSKDEPESPARIAVTNSYLEAAVRDLLGDGEPILRLAEPGMCPGHFDLRPSQVRAMRPCRLLLRMDFQKSLDGKLIDLTDAGLRVAEVGLATGLGRPGTYAAACRRVAEALVEADLLDAAQAASKLAVIERRMAAAGDWARARIADAGLEGAPVVASTHQADFCDWLGLNVVAHCSAADQSTVSGIDDAVQAGLDHGGRLVLANRPEGTRLAGAIAGRLEAPLVVLDNFPADGQAARAYDAMLKLNVKAIVEAASHAR